MNRLALLLASSAAGLLLAAGAAEAGVCSGEIMALQKQMEETPTMTSGSTVSPDAGPAPLTQPRAAVAQPGATLGAPPSADAGGGAEQAHAAPGGSGEAGSTPGSDKLPLPAARGGTLVQNGGSTVPPPAESQPMDSDSTQAAQLNTRAGIDPNGTDLTGKEAAAQALTRARALDQAGDEAGCMSAVNEAKSQLTAQ